MRKIIYETAKSTSELSIMYPILPNLSTRTPKKGVIRAEVRNTTVMKDPALFVSIPNIWSIKLISKFKEYRE